MKAFIKKHRNSNMELLRIVAMLFIVLVHLLGKTSAIDYISKENTLYYPVIFLYGACGMGINVLVIVSGYYWNKSRFKISKVINLWMIVFFYSVTLTILAKYFLKIEIIDGIKASIFPLTNRLYWFFSTYIGLYFLMPYLKILVENMERMRLRNLLLILTGLLSLVPTVFGCNDWLGDGGTAGIVWFIYLYLLGIYFEQRRYTVNKRYGLILLGGMLMIAPLAKSIIDSMGLQVVLQKNINIWFGSNSIFCVIASIILFHIFSDLKIENIILEKLICFLGQGCFGVYLIHNNRNISHFLWGKLQAFEWVVEKNNLIMMFVLVIIVFLLCNMVDHVREWIFRRLRMEKVALKIEEWVMNKLSILIKA